VRSSRGARARAARWRVGRGLADGRGAARCSVPAPPLRGDCAGQREWRRGSPRRLGIGGVAGSGRHGGVPVEGGSGRVAASSRAVLQLEAEAREGTASATSERRRKHGVEQKNPADGGSTLLKGGCSEGGPGSQATRGVERGRERGARAQRNMARAVGIGPRRNTLCFANFN
jgi:hypothetical protein